MTGIPLAIGGKLAESALLGKAKGILSAIPKPVWEALTVLGYAVGIYLAHRHYVHQHDTALTAKINAQWQAKLNAEVAKMSVKNEQFAQMANQLRKANDEESRRIASTGNDLRVLGPGAAACPNISSAPASPGRHVQSPAEPAATGPLLPAPDIAAVPWSWLVDRAQEHDQLRAEVQAWRDWYAQLVKNWPRK